MKKLILILLLAVSFSGFAKDKLEKSSKELMLKILDKNESLHSSFFSYKAKEVEAAAKLVLSVSQTNKDKLLKADIDKANEYLSQIKSTVNEDENKKFYGLANIYLVKIINKYDLGEKYQAYYCPMVRKRWIQNTKKEANVQNPYDASMPDCGGRL
ncbi:DUF3347 domain-containing protein [Bacteriovorax sp. Seq25_V]|uniref:DUF3347 domain-containing protein n=1 Tax=Bacteriovorax sp. Seq25_V TaxID=1201288 RepID=UPI00038A3896|nr:DUF3347 domain-containing protein [Bacteriovorax sp. Seq25_V]EQC45286.1 PF11827 family protein [Bacteriovorax sp. Seq25_V]